MGGASPCLLIALLGLICLSGCSDREITIKVTTAGIDLVRRACKCGSDCCPVSGTGSSGVDENMRARLVLARFGEGSTDVPLLAASPCVELRFDCDESVCLAESVNDALDAHMPAGLSSDGFDNLTDAAVVLMLHNGTVAPGCALDNFFGCAGFGATNDGTWDITCASCNGGSRARTNLTRPCTASCFAQQCYAFIEAHFSELP